jgi:hypothetical protein
MVRLVTVVKKDKFSLISWFEQFKKINMEADKLGGYTGMASDDRRQGGGRYIRRSS